MNELEAATVMADDLIANMPQAETAPQPDLLIEGFAAACRQMQFTPADRSAARRVFHLASRELARRRPAVDRLHGSLMSWTEETLTEMGRRASRSRASVGTRSH
jgi:hypothetical protein